MGHCFGWPSARWLKLKPCRWFRSGGFDAWILRHISPSARASAAGAKSDRRSAGCSRRGSNPPTTTTLADTKTPAKAGRTALTRDGSLQLPGFLAGHRLDRWHIGQGKPVRRGVSWECCAKPLQTIAPRSTAGEATQIPCPPPSGAMRANPAGLRYETSRSRLQPVPSRSSQTVLNRRRMPLQTTATKLQKPHSRRSRHPFGAGGSFLPFVIAGSQRPISRRHRRQRLPAVRGGPNQDSLIGWPKPYMTQDCPARNNLKNGYFLPANLAKIWLASSSVSFEPMSNQSPGTRQV